MPTIFSHYEGKTSKQEEDTPEESIAKAKNQYFNLYSKDLMLSIENVYKIVTNNREKYLKTSNFKFSGFTDEEKDKFEAETLTSLGIIEKSLSDLQTMLDAKGNKLECQNKSDYAHKKVAISCLFKKLNNLYSYFKKLKSVRGQQTKFRNELTQGKKDLNASQRVSVDREYLESTLAEEDKRELKREGMLLLQKYENDVQDVQDTQKEMMKISELMNQFGAKVCEQDMMTSQIMEDAIKSFDFLHEGNKNLNQAAEYAKSTGVIWCIYFMTLAIVLLIFDWIN